MLRGQPPRGCSGNVPSSMPASVASVELTGGAGFLFEDEVAAFFLAAMLAGSHPYGADLGTIRAVSWQKSGLGWSIDDLLVTFLRPETGILALSIKSDRQVTQTGFPEDFVAAAWEQFTSQDIASPFTQGRDLLALAVGELAGTVRQAWHTLLRDACLGSAEEIANRYSSPGQSNLIGRRLLQSLVRNGGPPTGDTVDFAKHLRLLHFDLRDTGSQAQSLAIWSCQQAIRSGQDDDARRLWQRLVGLAGEYRAAGGWLDVAGVVARLRGDFDLRDRIDDVADWRDLDRHSREAAEQVSLSIGGRVSLVRPDILDDLRAKVATSQSLVLVGDGGTGKSGLARRLVEDRRTFARYLWLNGASLDFESMTLVERHLGLKTPLSDLLSRCTASHSCLVLDGLEVFSTRALARAATILAALAPHPAARGWTIVATARPQAVGNVRTTLVRSGIDGSAIATRYIDAPSDLECDTVLATSPRLEQFL